MEEQRKLKKYYASKNIVQGNELIQVDPAALEFSAYPGQAETLKSITSDIIKVINKNILESPVEKRIEKRRYIKLSLREKPFSEIKGKLAAFRRVMDKLVDLGAIHKLVKLDEEKCLIQA